MPQVQIDEFASAENSARNSQNALDVPRIALVHRVEVSSRKASPKGESEECASEENPDMEKPKMDSVNVYQTVDNSKT